MAPNIEHLVADAAAFISNAPLREIASVVYTVPEVIAESCDKETRRRLKAFPVDVIFKEPSSESIKFVITFAKATGDYGSLSNVDLKVLALTCDIVKQFQGESAIKKEPEKKPSFMFGGPSGLGDSIVASKKHYDDGDCLPSDMITEVSDEEDEESEEESFIESFEEKSGNSQENTSGQDTQLVERVKEGDLQDEQVEDEVLEKEEDADDDDWITPENIAAVKRSMGVEAAEDKPVCVGCLTTDFAIQNVLVQMGLNVVAIDGKLIKQVKTYVMRCFGCMKITKDTSKKFCPHCGNKTLRRLATSLGEDGTVRYHLAKNFTNRIRGMKFTLPKPQGGKHAMNPTLAADQPRPDQRLSKKALQKVDILSADITAGSSPFKMNDVTSKSSQLGLTHKPQWAKRNPNENNRKGKTRRKK